MHIEKFGDKEYQVGDTEVIISNFDIRTTIFVDEVMGKNYLRKQQTGEEYLAKMAVGLIYRLAQVHRYDLIAYIIEGAFRHGYSLTGYKTKLYMHYMKALLEKGYVPEDPMKNTIEDQDRERKVLRAREELKYLGRVFAQENF